MSDKLEKTEILSKIPSKPRRKLNITKKDHLNWRKPKEDAKEEIEEKNDENKVEEIKEVEKQVNSRARIDTSVENLWKNPWIDSAKKLISEEQQEQYRKMGERFYSGWDFENGGPEGVLDIAVSELSEAIKSGLHPADLDENEREILKTKIGHDWYTYFGYTLEDIGGIKI